MAEYLTKEEVRQWRSSLEKITLEEFARRLGKEINEEKSTNDVVDKVMKDIKFDDSIKPEYQTKVEKITVIAKEALLREKDIVHSVKPNKEIKEVKAIENVEIAEKIEKVSNKKEKKEKVSAKNETPKIEAKKKSSNVDTDFPVILKKAFTAREQVVFDHLLNNKNKVVYAKDLAELLGLPRDYIYKYIKGIRTKMEQDVLSNAEKGGFILNV